eukprot:2151679-Lingulodinium_polyedra.AAC.1
MLIPPQRQQVPPVAPRRAGPSGPQAGTRAGGTGRRNRCPRCLQGAMPRQPGRTPGTTQPV